MELKNITYGTFEKNVRSVTEGFEGSFDLDKASKMYHDEFIRIFSEMYPDVYVEVSHYGTYTEPDTRLDKGELWDIFYLIDVNRILEECDLT